MTIIYSKKSKKFLSIAGGFVLLIVFIVIGSFYNETKGAVEVDQWNNVQKGMTVQEVVSEAGRPQSKTKNRAKIQESYAPALHQKAVGYTDSPDDRGAGGPVHDILGFMELEAAINQNKDVMMYSYLLNEHEHYIYFVDDISFMKY